MPTKIESNPEAPGESGALVWGDGLFTNAARAAGVASDPRRLLQGVGAKAPSRGQAPRATTRAFGEEVEGREEPAPKPAAKPGVPAAKPTPRVARAPAQTSAQAKETATPNWILPALIACAGAAALILLRFRLPALWRWARIDEDGERRFRSIGGYAGLGLVAVGLGFLVPMLFG